MKNIIKSWIQKLRNEPIHMFAVDALGALVSAFILFSVLRPFYKLLGIDENVFIGLALAAVGLYFVSFSGYLINAKWWKKHLWVVLISNCIYVLATIVVIFLYRNSVSPIAVVYFMCEMALIGFFIYLERLLIKEN